MKVNKMIVGLGNPGEKYADNRHNVGFMMMDELFGAKSWSKSKSGLFEYVWLKRLGDVELIKPQTFMNRSGDAVSYAYKKHSEISLDDLWVIHDDLDIDLGKYKIQKGKGPKQHNGVDSIERVMGSKDFWRVRIGVENRSQDSEVKSQRIPGDKFVLGNFTKDERMIIDEVNEEVASKLLEEFDGSI